MCDTDVFLLKPIAIAVAHSSVENEHSLSSSLVNTVPFMNPSLLLDKERAHACAHPVLLVASIQYCTKRPRRQQRASTEKENDKGGPLRIETIFIEYIAVGNRPCFCKRDRDKL
jgi:hypothetical protein